MDNLFPWRLGDRKRSFANAVCMSVVAAVLNAINLAIYTAAIVFVAATLWKSIG